MTSKSGIYSDQDCFGGLVHTCPGTDADNTYSTTCGTVELLTSWSKIFIVPNGKSPTKVSPRHGLSAVVKVMMEPGSDAVPMMLAIPFEQISISSLQW